MTPSRHTVVSILISIPFGMASQSWVGAITCFLSGIFIDLDHVIDFVANKKKLFRSYDEFFSFFERERKGKLYLIFHSYELLFVFWLLIMIYQLNSIWVGLALGMTVHMFCDQITNPLRPFVYFWVYRLRYRFAKEYIYTHECYQTMK